MSEQQDGLRLMGIRSKSEDSVTIHGLTVPAWFTTVLYRPDEPHSVTVFVRVDPDEGPLAEGVQINATPGAGATYKDAVNLLKGAPMDKLLHEALVMSAKVVTWQEGLDALGKPTGEGLTQAEQAALGASLEATHARTDATPMPVRRRSVTKELLEEVAQVYRAAVAEQRPPTLAVAKHFTTTHTTAARWVREARKGGILGPSRGPTAGEDQDLTASE